MLDNLIYKKCNLTLHYNSIIYFIGLASVVGLAMCVTTIDRKANQNLFFIKIKNNKDTSDFTLCIFNFESQI